MIDVVVVVSESERMSKPSEITVITGGAKGTDAWAIRWAWQYGLRIMCILPYNYPITRVNGKGLRLCGGHDPKLVHASAASHPGDLSLDVPRINMIWCNSPDTEADLACRAANKRLQRTYPSSSCKVNGLLQRNYWIIKKADTVYAFGKFARNSQGLECVDGGTGWGVEMARLMHKPLYLYSMTHNRWFEYDRVEDRFEACLEPITSLMGKTCAIIGTRNMEAHTDPWRSLQNMFSNRWGK